MNGLICNGIQRIVTDMILEDFLIAGLLGLLLMMKDIQHIK
jgi:hypothetical protein